MAGVTYDIGALVAAERNDRRMWALHAAFLAEEVVPSIPAPVLAGIETPTQSKFVQAKFATGSIAEAAALAAAGARARLVSKRTVSQDRTATAAIAEGDGE